MPRVALESVKKFDMELRDGTRLLAVPTTQGCSGCYFDEGLGMRSCSNGEFICYECQHKMLWVEV
jgi:hypothetical protein